MYHAVLTSLLKLIYYFYILLKKKHQNDQVKFLTTIIKITKVCQFDVPFMILIKDQLFNIKM